MELIIKHNTAVIDTNIEDLKLQLAEKLKKYEIEVTAENLKEAKTLAQGLNKLADEFDKRRKQVESQLSMPIKDFKKACDELVEMCKSGRALITKQIQVFDDLKRDQCIQLLKDLVAELSEGLTPEFSQIKYLDLGIMSNLTDKGALKKAVVDTIKMRVSEAREAQTLQVNALQTAELLALRAGVRPLDPEQVKYYFKTDPFWYTTVEILIQKKVADKARIEAETRAKIEAENKVASSVSVSASVIPEPGQVYASIMKVNTPAPKLVVPAQMRSFVDEAPQMETLVDDALEVFTRAMVKDGFYAHIQSMICDGECEESVLAKARVVFPETEEPFCIVPVSKLADLIDSQQQLDSMESMGLDNWEWYWESLEYYREWKRKVGTVDADDENDITVDPLNVVNHGGFEVYENND